MSRKPRKITVDSIEYLWRVKAIDPDFVSLRVWYSESPVSIFSLRYTFNNFWLFYGELVSGQLTVDDLQMKPITPKLVAEIIKQVVESYPGETNLNLEIDDGQLVRLPA